MPVGGALAQILSKASISDYDTEWVDPPTGGMGGGSDDGIVDSADISILGQDLTLTLGRSVGADLSDTVTLPTGGGGGGSTTTDRTRIEALSFTAVATTTTQSRQQELSTTPATLVFGDPGPLELVSATAAETTFTILKSGVYLMEWNAVITPAADRPEPCLRVLDNSDDSVLGETDPIYIRANSEGAYAVNRTGILVVPD